MELAEDRIHFQASVLVLLNLLFLLLEVTTLARYT
jgi:hypothetical protein